MSHSRDAQDYFSSGIEFAKRVRYQQIKKSKWEDKYEKKEQLRFCGMGNLRGPDRCFDEGIVLSYAGME